MNSEIVVPLLHKSRPIGALNILSRNRDQFTPRDVDIVRQFGAHVAVALVNARLFERSRRDAEAFETLAEIGREVASVLDLDELFARIAQLTKRVIDYRTFGILLLNEERGELEMKLAVQYGEKVQVPRVRLGKGSSAMRRSTVKPVLVADVSQDPRYIKLVPDVRSELAIPLLLKDRCIGVVDLESPELDAFSKRDVEILTLLASQAAVAIENARLYEEVRVERGTAGEGSAVRPARADGAAARGPPKRLKGIDVAAAFAPARELGGDFHDYLVAGIAHAGRGSGGCLRQGRAGGALQRLRGGVDPRTNLQAPLPAGPFESGGCALVGQHDPAAASARRVLLHALLHRVRPEAPRHDAREFGTAVPDTLHGRQLRPDRAARRPARLVPGLHLR